MEEKNKVMNEKSEKLSYEQLESVCHQLSEQVRALYKKLGDADMTNLFRRLDYLFAVLTNKDAFPKEFVESAIAEIIGIITIPSENTSEDKK